MGSIGGPMDPDRLTSCLQMLARRDRRRILRHVPRDGGENIYINDVVDELQATAFRCNGANGDEADRIASQLQHCHLPPCERVGILEHHVDRGILTYHPADQVEDMLDALREES